jgi:hypothetical protein
MIAMTPEEMLFSFAMSFFAGVVVYILTKIFMEGNTLEELLDISR